MTKRAYFEEADLRGVKITPYLFLLAVAGAIMIFWANKISGAYLGNPQMFFFKAFVVSFLLALGLSIALFLFYMPVLGKKGTKLLFFLSCMVTLFFFSLGIVLMVNWYFAKAPETGTYTLQRKYRSRSSTGGNPVPSNLRFVLIDRQQQELEIGVTPFKFWHLTNIGVSLSVTTKEGLLFGQYAVEYGILDDDQRFSR